MGYHIGNGSIECCGVFLGAIGVPTNARGRIGCLSISKASSAVTCHDDVRGGRVRVRFDIFNYAVARATGFLRHVKELFTGRHSGFGGPVLGAVRFSRCPSEV